MPKFRNKASLRPQQAGLTLIEMMVSLGVAGVVFVILISLLGQGATFSSIFHNSANAVESLALTINQLNSVMPQIVRIDQCGCKGATGTTRTNCLWDDTLQWADPHYNYGGVAANHVLLDAIYEHYHGGTNQQSITQLLRSNLGTFGNELGGCDTYGTSPAYSLGTYNPRGCKLRLRLFYTPPVQVSGVTPSTAGNLRLQLGSIASTWNAAAGAYTGAGVYNIGAALASGSGGVGVTEVACGLALNGTGAQQSGLIFMLNVKIKAKGTVEQSVNNPLYQTWYRGATYNYYSGVFRELKLKYSLPNLSYRGLYQWRAFSKKNCKENGNPTSSNEDCCSRASSGGSCIACVAAGVAAASDSACCSANRSGGVCI